MASLKNGIVKRGNTWSYVLRVTDASGISKPRWVGGFATAEQAKQARDQARLQAAHGEYVPRNTTTVKEYLEHWIALHSMQIRRRTATDYAGLAARYIYPHLGNLRLQAVQPHTLSVFYSQLLARGGKQGRPLAISTVNKVHAICAKRSTMPYATTKC